MWYNGIVILDTDVMTVPDTDILDARTKHTYLRGRKIFDSTGQENYQDIYDPLAGFVVAHNHTHDHEGTS